MPMTIKNQAKLLVKSLHTLTAGSGLVFNVNHHERGHGFRVYALSYGRNILDNGASLCEIDDLSIDNVPFILNEAHKASGVSLYFTITATADPLRKTHYCACTKFTPRVKNISAALFTSVFESAIRDDELKIVSSSRLAYVAFNDYKDQFTISTIGE